MNSSFSSQNPYLQIGWDSTSLGLLMECPRKYQLSMIHHLDEDGSPVGYAPRLESVHLTFGLLYHGACERYDHCRSDGEGHEAALHEAVRWTLAETWDATMRRPWQSDDKNKNRYTLVRTIVWYLDQFADDPVSTVQLANGKPAVELSFRYEIDRVAPTGEVYMICGHLDRLGILGDEIYVLDRKTSKNTINSDFFTKFNPDNQFQLYTFSSRVVYSQPVEGIICDAAQVAQTFSRFQRERIMFSEDQLHEWYADVEYWISQAEQFAEQQYWPMNRKACGNYGGCPFRTICSKAPAVRDRWISADFVRKVWDPLRVRGDI